MAEQRLEDMRRVIQSGESVLHGGTVISRLEDLPDEVELAMGDERRVAAAKDHIARERMRLAEQERQLDESLRAPSTTRSRIERRTETTYNDRRVDHPVIGDDEEMEDEIVTHGDSNSTHDGSMVGFVPPRHLAERRSIEDTHPILPIDGQRVDVGGHEHSVVASDEERRISREGTLPENRTGSRAANRAAARSRTTARASESTQAGTEGAGGSPTGAPLGNSGLTGSPASGSQVGTEGSATGEQGGAGAGSGETAPQHGPAGQ